VIGDPVVARLGVLGGPELPKTEEEKEGPPDKKGEHEPVNDVDEVIDVAAVIGKILRNPEPFGPIERNEHEKNMLGI
jgi:hypothetical protein